MKFNVAALAVLASASAVLAVPQPEADNHRDSYGYKDVDDYSYSSYDKHHYNGGSHWYNGNEWYYDGSRWYYFDKWGKKIYGDYEGGYNSNYKREAGPEALAEASHHDKWHNGGYFWNGHYWYYENGRYYYLKHGHKFYGKYHGPKFWKHKGWKREAAPEPEALPEAEAIAEAAAEPTFHGKWYKGGYFWNGHYWYYENGRYYYLKHGHKFYGKYYGPKFWEHKGWKRDAAPEPEAVAEAEPVAAPEAEAEAVAEAAAEPSKYVHKWHKGRFFFDGRYWYFDGRYYYFKNGRKFYGKYYGPKFHRH